MVRSLDRQQPAEKAQGNAWQAPASVQQVPTLIGIKLGSHGCWLLEKEEVDTELAQLSVQLTNLMLNCLLLAKVGPAALASNAAARNGKGSHEAHVTEQRRPCVPCMSLAKRQIQIIILRYEAISPNPSPFSARKQSHS